MKEIGSILREKRESLKISVEEVAITTKINVKILQALEEGDLNKLPAKTFVRGFIQSYAKYLGLNVNDIMSQFQDQMGSTKPAPQTLSELATAAQEKVTPVIPGSGRNLIAGIAIVITIIGIIIIQKIISTREAEMHSGDVQAITGNDTPLTIPAAGESPSPTTSASASPGASAGASATASPTASVSATPTATPTPTPTATPTPTPTPKPSAPAATATPSAALEATAPQEIIVEALDTVAVKVSIDGATAKEITLSADQIQTFKGKKRITLTTENGGAISIIHNGKELGVPGNLGQPKSMAFPR